MVIGLSPIDCSVDRMCTCLGVMHVGWQASRPQKTQYFMFLGFGRPLGWSPESSALWMLGTVDRLVDR